MRPVKPALNPSYLDHSMGIMLFAKSPVSRVQRVPELRTIEFMGESWIERGPAVPRRTSQTGNLWYATKFAWARYGSGSCGK